MKDQAEKLRLLQLNRESKIHRDKKIFSFTSGKGGTGKTFIALNTAFAMARLNKRILLVDMDFNLSNLHLFLNINPSATINDFIAGRKLMHEIITNIGQNINAIFGEPGSSAGYNLSDSQLNIFFNGISKISENYDFVILDTGAGADINVLNILRRCDENIFVVTTEPTSVMDSYVLMKFIYQNSGRNLFPVVINKSRDDNDGSHAFEKLQTAAAHFLNVELVHLGSINYSEEIRTSLLEQKLFLNSGILSLEAEQILSLGSRVVEYHQMANNNHVINSNHA